MTIKEIKELLKLIDESNLAEFKMETEKIKLSIRTNDYISQKNTYVQQEQPVYGSAPIAPTAPASDTTPTIEEETTNYLEVRSPIVGTFYRSPSPDKPAFVNVGDVIQKGDIVCIVEAMKLFNDIETEVSGKIVKVMVDDATPVEYDQVLFLVSPE